MDRPDTGPGMKTDPPFLLLPFFLIALLLALLRADDAKGMSSREPAGRSMPVVRIPLEPVEQASAGGRESASREEELHE